MKGIRSVLKGQKYTRVKNNLHTNEILLQTDAQGPLHFTSNITAIRQKSKTATYNTDILHFSTQY